MKRINAFSSVSPVQIVSVLLAGASVIGIIGWFIWPGPDMRTKKDLQVIQVYFDKNDFDGALNTVDQLLTKDPNNAKLLTAKAIATAQKGSLTFQETELGRQAAILAEKAIVLDPQSSEAHRVLAYAYEIQQNYSKAHENYQKAIELDPQNVAALFGDGHSYDLEGDMQKAAEKYQTTLRVNGSFDQAYVGLARVALQNNDTEKALEMYTKSIEYTKNARIKSESSAAITLIYLGKNDIDNAKKYSQQAVDSDGTFSSGWYVKGTTTFVESFNKKRYPEAAVRGRMINQSLLDLKKAALLNPNQAAVYLQIGTELSAIGQADGAAAVFKKGLEVVEKDITLGAADKVSMRAKLLEARELMVKVEAVRNKRSPAPKN